MDGKGKQGWCILGCAGVGHDNNEIINRTMLRFRPIAPKPVTSGTGSGNLLVDNKNLLFTGKRSKRKYVRVRKNNGYNKRKDRISSHEETEEDDLNKNVVTLQLLPEKTDNEKSSTEETWCNNLDPALATKSAKVDDNRQDPTPNWLNFNGDHQLMIDGVGRFGLSDQTVVMYSQRRVVVTVESWVTVESVTETCMDTRGLGSTDVERIKNLEKDTCPGFISDGLNRVPWVNEAYKKMVTESHENDLSPSSPEIETLVWLVIKEKFPSLYDCTSFTTKVRLQYNTWQKDKYSKIVPCDVFRMDGGGFAWRLDVEAALSLGR